MHEEAQKAAVKAKEKSVTHCLQAQVSYGLAYSWFLSSSKPFQDSLLTQWVDTWDQDK